MIQLNRVNNEKKNSLLKPFIDSTNLSERYSVSTITIHKQKTEYDSSPFKLVNLNQTFKKKFTMVEPEEQRPSISSYQDNKQPQQFKQTVLPDNNYVFNRYDIYDLTFSLIDSKTNLTILTVIFCLQIIIRYFSILCLIYVMYLTSLEYWEWILFLVLTYFFYCSCIVKISLKIPETKSQYILKKSFNCLEQNENSQLFQVIDTRKLGKSILRGIIPPEFSFTYIKNMTTSAKNLHIYIMINYIYNSIEAIIYYPFLLIYTIFVYFKNAHAFEGWIFSACYCIIILSEIISISISAHLLIHGCHKKGLWKSK